MARRGRDWDRPSAFLSWTGGRRAISWAMKGSHTKLIRGIPFIRSHYLV